MKRRDFLAVGAATGAALTVGVSLSGCGRETAPPVGGAAFAPDAWIRVGTDGQVVVMVDRSEMGQGVSTALPMLVAEELDADWNRVRFEYAPANEAYYNPLIGAQATGGSTAVMAAWVPLREAGAKARAMLVAAAAAEWGAPPAECRTEAGTVIHQPSGRKLGYGALAAKAARLPVPGQVPLKDPAQYRLIGKAVPRLDAPRLVSGATTYGIDVRPEGILTAVIARSPVFGGKLLRYDDARARTVPGVKHVVPIDAGVAVVADGFWAASKGRAALQVEWDEGEHARESSEALASRMAALAVAEGKEAVRRGEGGAALAGADKVIEAEYRLPFLAHACMEPMNCTAHVRDDGVTVWAPTQMQTAPKLFGGGTRGVAAAEAGVSPEHVTVITTNLGGGFGRRSETDFVREAVQVSKVLKVPVKVVWSREDDIQHDFYRPASLHRLKGGLGSEGRALAWYHHVVAPGIMKKFIPGYVPDFLAHIAGPMKGGVDSSSVEGARELAYLVPNVEVRYSDVETAVPLGFWRSVGHSHTAFAVESFIDELAAAAGKDPVQYRLDLLPSDSRARRVLQAAAERARWGTPLPEGMGRGVAVHESFGSFCAEVAEVEVVQGAVHVRRVVAAFDCGIVVNPEITAQQVESGIVFGLTAALKGRITIAGGRVAQGNFNDYPLLTMREMPVIEVHLVPSGDAPGGAGEPATPPIAPAVANALFAATGRRIRDLPLTLG